MKPVRQSLSEPAPRMVPGLRNVPVFLLVFLALSAQMAPADPPVHEKYTVAYTRPLELGIPYRYVVSYTNSVKSSREPRTPGETPPSTVTNEALTTLNVRYDQTLLENDQQGDWKECRLAISQFDFVLAGERVGDSLTDTTLTASRSGPDIAFAREDAQALTEPETRAIEFVFGTKPGYSDDRLYAAPREVDMGTRWKTAAATLAETVNLYPGNPFRLEPEAVESYAWIAFVKEGLLNVDALAQCPAVQWQPDGGGQPTPGRTHWRHRCRFVFPADGQGTAPSSRTYGDYELEYFIDADVVRFHCVYQLTSGYLGRGEDLGGGE